MESLLFLRGVAVGFVLAAPVGPVGVLCIRRALADGRHAAFIAGLGAACADTFFGFVAVFGVSAVSSFLDSYQTLLRLVGGLFMLVLGTITMLRRPNLDPAPMTGPGLIRDFFSTFLITLTNPATILASMGVFAAYGALRDHPAGASGMLIVGVFAGSALWWLVLSGAAGAARQKVSAAWMGRLNKGSGLVLLLSGLAILIAVAMPENAYFFK
ncbi:MAG TPA: LysE family transporter [Rhodospirillaceae bacterium]|nr:LysE family transporter [Rhodospirillaceae bacterium]